MIGILTRKEKTVDNVLPQDLLNICFSYLFNEKYVYGKHMTFFNNVKEATIIEVAKYVLAGEEKAIHRVDQDPTLLSSAITRPDSLGRYASGTLIQLAAMAGNFGPIDEQWGMVELLALTGGLSKSDIATQLAPIFSKEAMKKNKIRNEHILNVTKDFFQKIFDIYGDLPIGTIELKDAQKKCRPLVDKFRDTLMPFNPVNVITSGYLFDPQILVDVLEWIQKKLKHPRDDRDYTKFNSMSCVLFLIHGLGTLQYLHSARDAQVVRNGFTNLRTSRRSMEDGSSGVLGVDFYLGFDGTPQCPLNGELSRLQDGFSSMCYCLLSSYKNYVRHKQQTLQELCHPEISRTSKLN